MTLRWFVAPPLLSGLKYINYLMDWPETGLGDSVGCSLEPHL